MTIVALRRSGWLALLLSGALVAGLTAVPLGAGGPAGQGTGSGVTGPALDPALLSIPAARNVAVIVQAVDGGVATMPPPATRIVRRGFTSSDLRMRAASIITAQPMALSVAPVAECQESRCPPSMMTSSFLSVPGISATVSYDVLPSGYT